MFGDQLINNFKFVDSAYVKINESLPNSSTRCDVKQENKLIIEAGDNYSGNMHQDQESCGTVNKMDLLLDRLELIRDEVARRQSLRKTLLRKKLQQCRAEIMNSKANGRDPLSMLPEEVWTTILEYVDDSNDVANCAKTCTLFHRILDKGNANWHLEKVFPFLFNFLPKHAIANCRSVSKRWRLSVDNYLENYYNIEDKCSGDVVELERYLEEPKITPNEYNFEYYFTLPRGSYDDTHFDRSRDDMSLHSGNPIIGRSVSIYATPSQPPFSLEFPQFLNEFGNFIWHLGLKSDISEQELYSLCITTLSSCKNLRTLYLLGKVSEESNDSREMESLIFPSLSFLETVAIYVKRDCPLYHSGYQDKLLRKYSNQLKRVDVELWNCELYHSFQWTNLRELRVGREPSIKLLSNLVHLNAPNLREMNIRLEGKKPKFEKLMRVINHFPKLDHLELRICKTFCGVSDEEIISLPPEFACCTSVKTLEITRNEPHISYNFLICFPHLRKLILRHGDSDSEEHQLYEYDSVLVAEERVEEISELDVENQELQNGEDGIDDVTDEEKVKNMAEEVPVVNDMVMVEYDADESEVDNKDEEGSDVDNNDIEDGSDVDDNDKEKRSDVANEVEEGSEADNTEEGSGVDDKVEEKRDVGNDVEEGDLVGNEAGNSEEGEKGSDMEGIEADNSEEGEKGSDMEGIEADNSEEGSDVEGNEADNSEEGSDVEGNEADNSEDGSDVEGNEADNFEDGSDVEVNEADNSEEGSDVDTNVEEESDVENNAGAEQEMDSKIEDASEFDSVEEGSSEVDDNSGEGNESDNRCSGNHDGHLGGKLKNDLIQLQVPTSIGKRRENISQVHKSNIWEILTRLETVLVYTTDVNKSNVTVYTRKGYEMRDMDQLEMANLHWESAKKDAAHQKKVDSLKLQDLHKEQLEIIQLGQESVVKNDTNLVVVDAFEKVFPLIFSKLNRTDVLNCRGVCKMWCAGVDSFLENHFNVKRKSRMETRKHEKSVNREFDFIYKFRFPYTPGAPSSTRHDNLWEQMKLHERNPFIGRKVELQLNPFEGNVESLRDFLEHAGNFIWHVKLSFTKINNRISIMAGEFNAASYVILKLCSNIRSVYLTPFNLEKFEAYSTHPFSWSRLDGFSQKVHVPLPYLESLIFPGGKWGHQFQKKVLKKYHCQLKRLHCYKWYGYRLRSHQWSSLQELTVLDSGDSDRLLESLTEMHAPQLSKLCILLNGNAKLKTLVQVVHNFKNLRHVEIRFSKGFSGLQSGEVLSMSPGVTSTKSLESLEVVIARKCSFSFDFLIYFPHLKKLCIRTESLDVVQSFGRTNFGSKKPVQQNLVQLFQCMWQEENRLGTATSNIWEILPFLQTLKVCSGSSTINAGEEEIQKVYRRQINP